MKITLDYDELIKEMEAEIKEGGLSQKDTIQILRDEKAVYENYCPIIDWYYDKAAMVEEMETPLEEIYLQEEFSKEEWAQLKRDHADYKKQYQEDRDRLMDMKVKDVLTEMKQMMKLFH